MTLFSFCSLDFHIGILSLPIKELEMEELTRILSLCCRFCGERKSVLRKNNSKIDTLFKAVYNEKHVHDKDIYP